MKAFLLKVLISIVLFSSIAYAEDQSVEIDQMLMAGLYIGSNVYGQDTSLGGTPETYYLLLETGDHILLETGDKLLEEY